MRSLKLTMQSAGHMGAGSLSYGWCHCLICLLPDFQRAEMQSRMAWVYFVLPQESFSCRSTNVSKELIVSSDVQSVHKMYGGLNSFRRPACHAPDGVSNFELLASEAALSVWSSLAPPLQAPTCSFLACSLRPNT